jgi:glucose-1-phosphate thymidylyltransferase
MEKLGGILLAGGTGTRLFPNTLITNKHLLPIYDKPMIFYSLSILLLAGIRDVTLVCNKKDLASFKKVLGNGESLGISLHYSIQDSPKGIPDAIKTALDDKYYKNFLVTLGDNFIYGSEFFNLLKDFIKNNTFGICTQQVGDPKNFGIIKYGKTGDIEKIVEKSEKFISNDAVIGLYKFDDNFISYFKNISPSERNEYEIVDIINQYKFDKSNVLKLGRGTAWFDMGTANSFYNCTSFVKTIQDRQGVLVCSPHEIALVNNFIDKPILEQYIQTIKNSEYADDLKKVLSEQ